MYSVFQLLSSSGSDSTPSDSSSFSTGWSGSARPARGYSPCLESFDEAFVFFLSLAGVSSSDYYAMFYTWFELFSLTSLSRALSMTGSDLILTLTSSDASGWITSSDASGWAFS